MRPWTAIFSLLDNKNFRVYNFLKTATQLKTMQLISLWLTKFEVDANYIYIKKKTGSSLNALLCTVKKKASIPISAALNTTATATT